MSTAVEAPVTTAFEVTVSRDEFLAELAAARQVVTNTTVIPILSNVLLEAVGPVLYVTATDLQRTVTTSLVVKAEGWGACTVPARKLLEYVKLLPPGEIHLKLMDNNWLQIRSGRSKTKMVGMSAETYPKRPEYLGHTVTLPSDTLATMIGKISLAVSEEEARYTLKAAQLTLEGSRITLTATDGHRLARVTAETTEEWEKQTVLVPGDALDVLRVLLAKYDGKSIVMGEDQNHLFFYAGPRQLIASKMSGSFPNVEAVIPKPDGPGLVLDPPATLATLRRALTFTDAKTSAVQLTISATELTFTARSQDIGEAAESLEIHGGTERLVGFNGIYLREFLEIADGPVELHLKDSSSAALFVERFDSGMEYRYVLMPMRI